jgi:hypothetical protein
MFEFGFEFGFEDDKTTQKSSHSLLGQNAKAKTGWLCGDVKSTLASHAAELSRGG